jgi:hypothetical protein
MPPRSGKTRSRKQKMFFTSQRETPPLGRDALFELGQEGQGRRTLMTLRVGSFELHEPIDKKPQQSGMSDLDIQFLAVCVTARI